MTTEKMTVHKALSELKILDSRIIKAIGDGVYCSCNEHINDKIAGVTIAEYEKLIQGSYDKVIDLINRRNAIKNAVALSNAVTRVEISGTEYTVAEAINMKDHGIEYKEILLDAMENQYSSAKSVILNHNGKELEDRADKYVTGIYGAKEGKTNTDDFEKARKDYVKAHTYDLIDPIGVNEKIENLESEVSDFKSEVDAALSVSNAITEIEISY